MTTELKMSLQSADSTLRQISRNKETMIHFIQTEYDESSITQTCEKIKTLTSSISRVCICNGILHNEDIWPEKRIEELNINIEGSLHNQ